MMVVVPAAGMLCLRDRERTLLIVSQAGATHWLAGSEAALWDWLLQGHSYASILRLWQVLLSMEAAPAEALLHATLDRWLADGLLEHEDG
ncbi:MAG: hypothetical protein ACYC5O_07920 [Anaerolineae bacterium]